MKTKPFDLEAAKRSDPICRVNGDPLRFIECSPESPAYPVLCMSPDGNLETYTTGGLRYNRNPEGIHNIFMLIKTKTVWVNLYLNGEGDVTTHGVTFGTEEAAANYVKESILRTVSVELPI